MAKDLVFAVSQAQERGETVVFIAIDGVIVGFFALADSLREDAALTVRYLRHSMGLRVAMLTGDTVDAARRLGSELGIDEIRAGALPGHKVDFIKALQAEGNVVAMIGDGINDAPALSQADVGIAVGAGTEIAIAEADMILVKSRLLMWSRHWICRVSSSGASNLTFCGQSATMPSEFPLQLVYWFPCTTQVCPPCARGSPWLSAQ